MTLYFFFFLGSFSSCQQPVSNIPLLMEKLKRFLLQILDRDLEWFSYVLVPNPAIDPFIPNKGCVWDGWVRFEHISFLSKTNSYVNTSGLGILSWFNVSLSLLHTILNLLLRDSGRSCTKSCRDILLTILYSCQWFAWGGHLQMEIRTIELTNSLF